MHALSVLVETDLWNITSILRSRWMKTRTTYATTTVGACLAEGFTLLPTFEAPHFSLVVEDVDRDLVTLYARFSRSTQANPHAFEGWR